MKILIIITLLTLILFYKLYKYKYSSFINYNLITFNYISDELKYNIKKYANTINKSEIFYKTGKNINKKKLYSEYLNNIIPFSDIEKNVLTNNVNYIKENFNKYPQISNNEWNFIKLNNKLEKGMPFTIGKHIFISQMALDNLFNDRKKNIINLLIHEKIHIIQRYNQYKYNNIYKKHMNYTYYKKLFIRTPWNKLKFSNPDGIDIKWGIKYNNKYYLPMLIFINNNIEQVVIKLNKINNIYTTTKKYMNIYDFPPFKKYPNDISLYHPNEIVAYMIPKLIIK